MSTTTASAPSAASTAPSTITTVLSADEIGSVQNTIRGVIIATWILAVLAVSFRLFARRLSGAGFWWDDWLMVPALVRMVNYGLGEHWQADQDFNLTFFELGLWVSEICWTLVVSTVKLSVLAFYWRLFGRVSSFIRLAIRMMTVAVMLWGIAVLLATIFRCIPVPGNWDEAEDDTCRVDIFGLYYGSSASHVFTDIAILALPINPIRKLHMSRTLKQILYGIFALGGLVTIVSIIRLVWIIRAVNKNDEDPTWQLAYALIWTSVETNMAIVCACLPSLRPILALLSKRFREHSADGRTTNIFPMETRISLPNEERGGAGRNQISEEAEPYDPFLHTSYDPFRHASVGGQPTTTKEAISSRFSEACA
ncbi:hypothetical protein MMC28_010351 [Mycoblastus sanguinarius]|nr:hypothetical protein [Mycoblastus sanguinarius]